MTNGASTEGQPVAIKGTTRWARWAVVGLACALVIGVYAWSANSGFIELSCPNAEGTYYNLLVRGFRAGQLNLKTDVPPVLDQMADPYDPVANEPWRWTFGHPLHDLSYYKGKLYLYFGITPALVLFWPYAALTGHYLLHKDAVTIFFSAGFLVGVGLLLSLWRRYFADVKFWVVVPCIIALGLANFAPVILERCDVYEVAISCGYAMTMLALAGLWGTCHDSRRQWQWLAVASLAYGLAVGARPSLLGGAVILLVPVFRAWRENRTVWSLLMAAAIPIALVGVGLMCYNVLRFDHPLDFGQHYQLSSTRQDTMKQFSLRYLWFNARVIFLQPARWSGHFPFVDDIVAPALPAGAGVAEHPFGVLTNVPLTWLALAVPLILWNRSATTRSMLRCFLGAVAVLFGICALTIGLYFTMCLRYEVEFAGVLVFLATIGILGLERVLASQPAWRRLARFGWVLLLAFSTAFNLLASLGLRADARTNLGAALLKRREVDPAISAFQEALKIKPEDVAARIGLGAAFRQKGRLDEAIAQYQLALRIQPDEAQAWINLGNIFQKKGDLAEAIAKYQKALQISPESAEAHYDLASAFRQNGRTDDVISQLEEALQSSPYFVEARYNLGNALFQKGRLDEAIAQYQKALEIKPDYAQAHYNLGNALLQKGRDGEAISHFEQALQIEPNDPKVQNNLAWLLAISPQASLRDGGKAVELARRANAQTGGNNPFILRTLAAALAETGQFSEAVDTAQRAARLAGEQSETALGAQLQSEMELYRRARPFHDPGQIH